MATTVNQEFGHDRAQDDNVLNTVFARSFTLNWQVILFTTILLLAIFTRFYDLGERVMSHDESLHTQYSYNLYTDGQFEHTPLMHGPILFHFTALSYFLFGDSDFTSRIYPALLGVLLVMSPLLFRRWLGRWGTILASLMFLVSPLLMYYNRYLRHDTPSILSAVIMAWAIMMYLSGPETQRRRAHWLYIIAASMIWNLGSKETAFIYIAIFGAFLTIYWLVRMAQHFFMVNGKPLFETIIMGFSLAGMFSLLMILVFTVGLGNVGVIGGESLSARMNFIGDQFGVLLSGQAVTTDFATFLSWLGLSVVFLLATTIGTGIWVFRRRESNFQPTDAIIILINVLLLWALSILTSLAVALIVVMSISLLYAALRFRSFIPFGRPLLAVLGIVLVIGAGLLVFEELSHEPARADSTEVQQQPVPGQETETVIVESDFTLLPIVAIWLGAFLVVGGLLYARTAGWFDILDQFPEFDILIVMGSLILPWLTAFFIYATNPDAQAYANIANGLPTFLYNLIPTGSISTDLEAARVGRVLIGLLAWIPMMSIAVVAGLTWNWRRWIICFAIFHIIFAFFFTTVFTNIQGLATGMIYSLEYWLEQQGERRGSQPQYYYLLVIMPMYEFLPIIGSVLAMFGGMIVFWRRKREYVESYLFNTGNSANLDPFEEDAEIAEATESEVNEKVKNDEAVVREVDPRWRLDRLPFLLFVAFWAVLNLYAYTLSGEKMPWLGTHMTVPMILLAGWYFGRIIDRIDLHVLMQRRGWIYFILLPLGLVVAFQIISPFFGTEAPFQGNSRLFQTWTYQWLAVVFVGGLVLYAVLRLLETTGWGHLRRMFAVAVVALLAVVTFRSAWVASFINYDEATEFLVYAHGGSGNGYMVDALRDLSIRTTGGLDLRFGYDDGMSWPGSWYFRDFSG
ncbi:MAG: TIGR03663 family protein, partial [Aggregatilineales bacterium]